MVHGSASVWLPVDPVVVVALWLATRQSRSYLEGFLLDIAAADGRMSKRILHQHRMWLASHI